MMMVPLLPPFIESAAFDQIHNDLAIFDRLHVRDVPSPFRRTTDIAQNWSNDQTLINNLFELDVGGPVVSELDYESPIDPVDL